jgi:hypothetical protein
MTKGDRRNDAAAAICAREELDDLEAGLVTAADELSIEDDSEDDDDGPALWWARLPDFIKPTYPFDLPPDRLPFAQRIFTLCGAPARCPLQGCRRSEQCDGGDGPPCFRADREFLHQILFLAWMAVMGPATDDEGRAALRSKGSPYRWPFDPPRPPHRRTRRS